MKPNIMNRMHALRIDVEADVQERQISAILSELGEAPAAPIVAPRLRRTRRRAVVTLAAALALLLPVAAIAAENAVPGEILYPVKQSTEWVRSLIDPSVSREHRVDELETVIERGDPIEVVTDRFGASVDAVEGQDPELIRRVEIARQTVRDRYGVDLEPSSEDPGSKGPSTDPELGNSPGPGTGTQRRNDDGAIGGPSPTTDGDRLGADDALPDSPDDGSKTQSTSGQPTDTPDYGSGSNRP